MKLTYQNCDQLKLVRGKLIHRKTGKQWVEGSRLCPSCGDAYLRRTDKPHNLHCEKNCHNFGKGNSLSKQHKIVLKTAPVVPNITVAQPNKTVSALLPTVQTMVSAVKKTRGDKTLGGRIERGLKAMWKAKRDEARMLLAKQVREELTALQGIERTQDPTDDLAPFIGSRKRSPMSDETKQKISAANSGRKRSMETRLKMRNARLGKKYAIINADACLKTQMMDLKRNGQSISDITTVAIKKEHVRLTTLGRRVINRYRSIVEHIEKGNK